MLTEPNPAAGAQTDGHPSMLVTVERIAAALGDAHQMTPSETAQAKAIVVRALPSLPIGTLVSSRDPATRAAAAHTLIIQLREHAHVSNEFVDALLEILAAADETPPHAFDAQVQQIFDDPARWQGTGADDDWLSAILFARQVHASTLLWLDQGLLEKASPHACTGCIVLADALGLLEGGGLGLKYGGGNPWIVGGAALILGAAQSYCASGGFCVESGPTGSSCEDGELVSSSCVALTADGVSVTECVHPGILLAPAPVPAALPGCATAAEPLPSLPGFSPCDAAQDPHTYFDSGVIDLMQDAQPRVGAGVTDAFDGCSLPAGDGDPETGVGGGAFPAGPCVSAFSVAHHANAAGSAYYISSVLPLVPAALSVGTDGGSGDGVCSGGNSVVTGDPVTDPFDCGSGTIGLSSPMIGASIYPNQPGLTCTPESGLVVAFVLTGPILVDNGHCILPAVYTYTGNDIADPTNPTVVMPTVDAGDQTGCTTLSVQTLAVSVEGVIGDAGF